MKFIGVASKFNLLYTPQVVLLHSRSLETKLYPFNKCEKFWTSSHGNYNKNNKFLKVYSVSGSAELESKQLSTSATGSKFQWPSKDRPRICILGGGFGGLYTALRLEAQIWSSETRPQVVLIDQSDRFVFKPLLYELLTREVDEWEIAPRFTDLLAGTDVQFVRDTVELIQPSQGEGDQFVKLKNGLELQYDWLVLSLGSESRLDIVPGAKELSQPFSTLQDAIETEKKLKFLERRSAKQAQAPIRVTVVGAGYSGVELAATLAERLGSRGRIQIVDPANDICPGAPEGNRKAAKKVLTDKGVELLLGVKVVSVKPSESSNSLIEPSPTSAVLEIVDSEGSKDGTSTDLETDLVLWTVGTKSALPQSEGTIPFPVNGRGQADTEETLRVRGFGNVFAIGDASSVKDASGKFLAPTAQVAMQEADTVSWNLWASINKRPLVPFRYTHLGEMLTLGTQDAAITLGFINGVTLDGPLAHAARKLAYLYRQPTPEHMVKVGFSWFAKSAVDAAVVAQDTLIKVLGTKP